MIKNEAQLKSEETVKYRTKKENIEDELKKAQQKERALISSIGTMDNVLNNIELQNRDMDEQNIKNNIIKDKIKLLEDGPVQEIQLLENKYSNQDEIIKQQRSNIDQIKGQIIQGSIDGSYSTVSIITNKVEALKERLNKENIKANALELLNNTLNDKYQHIKDTITVPIKKDVESYLSYVTSDLHNQIELDDNLLPVRLSEKGLNELALQFDQASSGLKEALALCIRLAIAKHLCKEDSQCLILDDPFIHVSGNRQTKIIELLNKNINENSLQLIILTHRPTEFTGLSGKMLDITLLK